MKLTINPSVTPKPAPTGNRPDQNVNGANEQELHSAGDFAKVFESLGKSSEQNNNSKTQDTKETTSTRESEKSNSENRLQEGKKTEKDGSSEKDSKGDSKSDQNAVAAASAYGMADNRVHAPTEMTSMPPARAILHIADLEKIVSSLRVQNVEGQQQVTITLKNSVFEGLKVRLTTDSQQRVRAEFIAASEKVKEIIDSRGGELSDILKRRGIKLSELQTSVGGDATGRGDDNERRNADMFDTSKVSSRRVVGAQTRLTEQISDIDDESGASYRA